MKIKTGRDYIHSELDNIVRVVYLVKHKKKKIAIIQNCEIEVTDYHDGTSEGVLVPDYKALEEITVKALKKHYKRFKLPKAKEN